MESSPYDWTGFFSGTEATDLLLYALFPFVELFCSVVSIVG